MNVSKQAGGFDTFNMSTIGMGIAYAFVILVIAYVAGKEKNFNLAKNILCQELQQRGIVTQFDRYGTCGGFVPVDVMNWLCRRILCDRRYAFCRCHRCHRSAFR